MNGAYCVSKHAMESLGEIYRRELFGEGIDVVSIRSGPIQSEIWRKNLDASKAYEDTPYAHMAKKTHGIMEHAKKSALHRSSSPILFWILLKVARKSLAIMLEPARACREFLAQALCPSDWPIN